VDAIVEGMLPKAAELVFQVKAGKS
jgi:hypothetical protein